MRCATEPGGRLLPLSGARLPGWCDDWLAPPRSGDFFAGRAWYDTLLAQAMPAGATPLLALGGQAMLLPLLRQGRRLRSLVTPYSPGWAPLIAPGAGPAEMRAAGQDLGRLLRGRAPTMLEALDPGATSAEALLAGLGQAGLKLARFAHFGNWHGRVEPGIGWAGYLAARPSALRATIRRKAAPSACFALHHRPGPALEDGIAAYVHVRARSWKPLEPFPDFDPALMRAAAATGTLRLGVMSDGNGAPLAAQYWVVSGGQASLLKLAHDEAARAASPGTALTAWMIRGLIDDDQVTALDLGRGDDAYKALWVEQRRQRFGVMVTDPWHPAGWLELTRQAAARGRRWLRGHGRRVA